MHSNHHSPDVPEGVIRQNDLHSVVYCLQEDIDQSQSIRCKLHFAKCILILVTTILNFPLIFRVCKQTLLNRCIVPFFVIILSSVKGAVTVVELIGIITIYQQYFSIHTFVLFTYPVIFTCSFDSLWLRHSVHLIERAIDVVLRWGRQVTRAFC